MEEKTLNALKWIVRILSESNIPYCIGGGMAMHLYGSDRQVNDIDISVSGKYFLVIVPLVKEYITAGPKYYKNDKWDCTTLSLDYNGQEIDLTDADTLMMSKKDGTGWIKNKEIYQKYPSVIKEVDGTQISLMDPRVIFEYKQELGGEHQESDLKFLEEYIKDNFGSTGTKQFQLRPRQSAKLALTTEVWYNQIILKSKKGEPKW